MNSARRILLAAIAAAALLAVPTASRAGDTYLALKGGVWVPTASDGYSAISGSIDSIGSGKFPASGDVELAYGATMGIIGAQIATGYMWSSTTTNGVTVKANAVPLYAVGQLRLPIFFIQPYLELGIGGLANFASAQDLQRHPVLDEVLVPGRRRRGRGLLPRADPAGRRGALHVRHAADLHWGDMKLSGVNITANVGYIF